MFNCLKYDKAFNGSVLSFHLLTFNFKNTLNDNLEEDIKVFDPCREKMVKKSN